MLKVDCLVNSNLKQLKVSLELTLPLDRVGRHKYNIKTSLTSQKLKQQ